MGQARADIPREGGYDPGSWANPIRANAPFTPATGNQGPKFHLPLVGLAVVAGVVLLLEHLRKGR